MIECYPIIQYLSLSFPRHSTIFYLQHHAAKKLSQSKYSSYVFFNLEAWTIYQKKLPDQVSEANLSEQGHISINGAWHYTNCSFSEIYVKSDLQKTT